MNNSVKSVRHEAMRIGGEKVKTQDVIDVRYPFTDEVIGTVPAGNAEHAKRAFEIAANYRPRLTRYERQQILFKTAELIRERREEIAHWLTLELGICHQHALYETGRSYDVFMLTGQLAILDDGQIFSCDLTPHGKDRKIFTKREPVRAISAITPVLNDLNDNDLDKAAMLAVAGATGNSGQRCTAVKRILAQESIADKLVVRILEHAKAMKFGDPMDPDTQLGCVVHAQAAETFEARVYDAESKGAKVLYNPGSQGALLPPITVDHVPHDSELVMEETFGPIVPIVRVPDNDEAVMGISNATPFGLSSGVCTNNLHRATAFIEGLDVGTVNVWEQPGYRIEMSPFGGIKDSGNGVKEGALEAMKFFTNVKTYSLPWPR